MFCKLLIKLIIFLKNILPLKYQTHHKYLNKSQVTNLNVVINSLKNRGYIPDNIFDIGCYHGLWSKQISKIFSGSSVFEEISSHPRKEIILKSSLLSDEMTSDIKKTFNNLIKIDAQGSEIKILKGLHNYIYNFEVVILEVSVHEYNKNAPLFDDIMLYMKSKNFILYDIYDLKRLGGNNSFLIQFDCVYVRNNSSLLNVKF
jgi:hypothetical protein